MNPAMIIQHLLKWVGGGTPSLGLTCPHVVGTTYPYIPFIFSAQKIFQKENL
jgi:hypothetical protein